MQHRHCRPVFCASLRAATALWLAAAPLAALAQATAPAGPAASAAAAPADTARKAVATPLQAAGALVTDGKAKEALAKVAEAEAVGSLTPYELMILWRTRAAAAQVAGDMPLVMQSIEAALATDKVPADERVGLVEALVGVAARERDHARVLRWAQRYIDLKGPNDSVRLLRIQSQASSGDEAGALAALSERITAADKAGTATTEQHLRLLTFLQRKVAPAAAPATLERLAVQYPRPEYWADTVSEAARRAGDNERTLAELYRLMRATGTLTTAGARSGLAEMALRAGQPAEAQTVLQEGFAAGVLGTGADAAAHQKAREQARKLASADVADRPAAEAAAKRTADGNALVQLGWSIVAALPANTGTDTAGGAAAEQGLALIEQGIAKGGLRRAAEAQLHLGVAQLAAGRKDAARQTLAAAAKAASAAEPLAEPIRLWALWAAVPAMLPKAN